MDVLLFGNGIIRAFSDKSVSWDDLLKRNSIPCNEEEEKLYKTVAFPLQVVLRTNNHVDQLAKNESGNLYGEVNSEDLKQYMQELLSCG